MDCNLIAIYPIGGWWKTRTNLNKYNNRTRYSLLVSLDTPTEVVDIDIYNAVKIKIDNLIAVPIPVEVEIPIGNNN